MLLMDHFYSVRRAYKKEILFVFATIFCVVILLSLYSYDNRDTSWFHYSSDPQRIQNLCGLFGAQCAALCVYFFGVAAYILVPFLCAMWLWLLGTGMYKKEWGRILATVGILLSGTALCSLHGIEVFPATIPGGYMGYVTMSFLYRLFDRVGTLLILYAGFYASLVLLIQFSFMSVLHKSVSVVSSIYDVLIRSYGIQKGYAFFYDVVCFLTRALRSYFEKLYRASFGRIFRAYTMRSTIEEEFFAPKNSLLDQGIVQTGEGLKSDSMMNLQYSVIDSPKLITTSDMHSYQNSVMSVYTLPNEDIFGDIASKNDALISDRELKDCAHILEEKLERFGVYGSVTSIKSGPVVTLFEYQPKIDTKLSKILALEDDLALALQALSIRILAPIPGRSVVGFEVAYKHRKDVLFHSIMKSPEYSRFDGALPLILGQDTVGSNVVVDLVKMPHLLVAGSTGSGKSVALHAMLASLLCKCTPNELRLILLDPKCLEFTPYADIGHLLFPIVSNAREAVPVLKWVLKEMKIRYERIAQSGVRNISEYNKLVTATDRLHFIVIVIDELSDLMMIAGREMEDLIIRITQMARAAGIHMIVATQRPSVDVITGLIKVNFPSRISCRVASKIDSRTILDCGGADKLLGKGDMLFLDSMALSARRVHGAYISEHEVGKIVSHIKSQCSTQYLDVQESADDGNDVLAEDEELYRQVVSYLGMVNDVSISSLQRQFRIGYNRSARIIALLETRGLIMPSDGGKTRRVIK